MSRLFFNVEKQYVVTYSKLKACNNAVFAINATIRDEKLVYCVS